MVFLRYLISLIQRDQPLMLGQFVQGLTQPRLAITDPGRALSVVA